MKPLLQFAVIAVLTLAGAGGTWLLKGTPKEKVFTCDPKLLKQDEICPSDVSGNVLWVDARSRAEWKENGLNGSVLWNLDPKEDAQQFEAEVAMRVVDAGLVVVYCGSEACGTSRQIADRIRALDLGPQVKVLHGGWEGLKDPSSKP